MNTCIETYTHKKIDIFNLDPDSICIEDIARALSMICRFAGHCNEFYSVAQHSVLLASLFEKEKTKDFDNSSSKIYRQQALLHDAAEAYIGDVPTPQKRNMGWWDGIRFWSYQHIEVSIVVTIYNGLGLDCATPRNTRQADKTMLVTEIRDIMPPSEAFEVWTGEIEPLPETIRPWPPEFAENEFLLRYRGLTR